MNPPSVLLRSWLVACSSAQLAAKPVARTILGQHLVLFRSEQGVSVLPDRCPHRNAPLSAGRIVDNCIQCPYHGWRFNGAGDCTFRPGAMDVVSPALPLVSCRSVEQDGFIWVCLHPEPLSEAPVSRSWSTDPGFDSFLWESQVEASLPDALENLLDGTHTPFVHAGLIRSEARRQIFSATVRLRDGLVEAEYLDEQKQNGLISQLFERDRTASFGRFIPPCVAELEYRSKQGTEFVLNSHFTPIDDRRLMVHSKIYLRRSRLPFWIKRLALTPFLKRVMHQDQDILKLQQENMDRFGEASFQSWEGDLMRGWIDTWLRSGRLPDSVPERTIRFEL